jgi:protocatechuate 3,4-dioxygenase beta subunit
MDLDQAIEEFPVTTVLTNYHSGDAARGDRRAIIAGTVRDRNSVAVRDAWVRIEPAGFTTVTDAAGRFVFDNVAPGAGVTLRARAPGFTEATLPNAQIASLDIPSIDGRYDLTFS